MDISQAACPGCGKAMRINRTHCHECDVFLEGEFELSPLAKLSLEDQMFVIAFLRNHGSIKKMESLFGISYPTVKNRLNAIGSQLDSSFEAPPSNSVILEQLARGEISVEEALERMS
jgi:hypothetical protein